MVEEVVQEVKETPERDFESEARVQGWKPQEEFDGDTSRWVDAKTFVERGEQWAGYLKPQKDRLERELRRAQQLNKDLSAHHERLTKMQADEIAQLEVRLQAERKRAINDGNGEAFDKADKQLAQVQEQKRNLQLQNPSQQTPPQKDLTPTAQEWLGENQWYLKDKTLRAVADTYADELKQLNPNMPEKEYFDSISAHVKQELPQKFKTQKSSTPGFEEGSRRTGGQNFSQVKEPTYKNLPADAKRECDRMANAGMIKDKELYAKAYFAQGD